MEIKITRREEITVALPEYFSYPSTIGGMWAYVHLMPTEEYPKGVIVYSLTKEQALDGRYRYISIENWLPYDFKPELMIKHDKQSFDLALKMAARNLMTQLEEDLR